MHQLKGFIKKEFYHIFRDKRTMLVLFGMPLALMLLFGFVITNEVKNANIAILDNSNDYVTRNIISKLTSSGYFIVSQKLNSNTEINSVFKQGKVKQVIVFENNFAQKLYRQHTAKVQIIADASDANYANLIVNYATGIIRSYNSEINKNQILPLQIIPESRMMFNQSLKGVYMFIPGIMAMILMLICALMTSISIVREKELGTMEVLLASPLSPLIIILGKVIPYVLISFINAIIIILMGYWVFNMPVMGSIPLLLAQCLLFIILALSLGILISNATTSQQVAMMLSMVVLMLPTILLSGFIFPIENMPRILQWICYIMPPKYFIIIVKGIMIKGVGLNYLWKETLILIVITVLLLGISIKKFKIRLT